MKIALVLLIGFGLLIALAWLIAASVFAGEDQSRYDFPRHRPVGTRDRESPEHRAAAQEIADGLSNPPRGRGKEQLRSMRTSLDERGESVPIRSSLRPVETSDIRGEWVIAPEAESDRRLLYFHGGGHVMGSPKSHRPIASALSERSRSAVLAIDYRLMPEHTRMDGVEDCRAAYKWVLENGPDGPAPAKSLVVAGDSSGGTLALVTIAWARDSGLRPANAVVVLSPQTDATLASRSLTTNIDTDIMQGKMLGPLARAPKAISLWISFLFHRINPRHPIASPLLGSLSDLPPTLIQVSEAEMFLDDAIRYANKANEQGSLVVLQIWPFVMHVWHAFPVPEADEAFVEIGQFITAQLDVDSKRIPE